MKIVPSEDLKKHLMEQNVKNPEGGFDVYDVPDFEYEAEKLLLLPSHIGESAEAFEDRLQYRLIWKLYGVPANGSQKGVDLTAIQRIEAMRREVAEVVEKHLPNVSADISKAMNLGHSKVVDALSALKTFEGESHAEMLRVKTEFYDSILTLAQRAWKFAAGALGAIIVLLAAMAVFAVSAHCQIDVIKFQDSSGTTLGVAAAPFTLKVASGCTWSRSGSIWTIGCTTGTVTNNPGTPSTSVQYNCAGAFCGIPEVHLGAVLIDQGPGVPPAFADPFVQGTQAAGSVTQPNPVLGAVWDGTNLRALLGDSSGRQTVNINGTVPVSGSFWQATQPVSGTFWQTTQPVSIATMPSTPVTGTFWQATQPVSGTFFQATQPVSNAGTFSVQCTSGCAGGASTPADTFANPTTAGLQMTFGMLWNGTSWDRWYGDKTNGAFVNVKNASLAVTGTFWQATQPVSGTFWQATQPISAVSLPLPTGAALDASLTTLDTDVKSNVTLHAGSNLIGKAGFDPTTPGTTNGVSMYSAALQTGNITTNATSITVTTAGYSIATVTVHGTYAGVTYVFEFSDDAGTTYYPTTCTRTDTNAQVNGDGPLTNTNRAYDCSVYAASNFRVRSTAFTSGSAVVGITLSAAPIEAAPTVAVAGTVPVSLASAPTTAVTNQGLTDLDATVGAVGSAIPANAMPIGGTDGTNLVRYYVDPCQRGIKTYVPVSISTATTVRFAAPAASKRTYLCAVVLFSAAADNVNIIEGTGGTCGTGTAGVMGGTTAATGFNAAANGGFTAGNGQGAIMATAGTNVDMCLITSAAVQLSGHIAYAQAP